MSPPPDPRPVPLRADVTPATVAGETMRVLARRGVLVAVPLVSALWLAVVLGRGDPAGGDPGAVAALRAAGCAYDTRFDPGREHVDAPSYTVDPPAGGDHLREPAAAGVPPTPPPDGELVHALEHGLVVVWLGADAPEPGSAGVRSFAAAFPDDVVVVRRAALRGVAATAWHRRVACPAFDPAVLRTFVCAFGGRGPERVAARDRAACD